MLTKELSRKASFTCYEERGLIDGTSKHMLAYLHYYKTDVDTRDC